MKIWILFLLMAPVGQSMEYKFVAFLQWPPFCNQKLCQYSTLPTWTVDTVHGMFSFMLFPSHNFDLYNLKAEEKTAPAWHQSLFETTIRKVQVHSLDKDAVPSHAGLCLMKAWLTITRYPIVKMFTGRQWRCGLFLAFCGFGLDHKVANASNWAI